MSTPAFRSQGRQRLVELAHGGGQLAHGGCSLEILSLVRFRGGVLDREAGDGLGQALRERDQVTHSPCRLVGGD